MKKKDIVIIIWFIMVIYLITGCDSENNIASDNIIGKGLIVVDDFSSDDIQEKNISFESSNLINTILNVDGFQIPIYMIKDVESELSDVELEEIEKYINTVYSFDDLISGDILVFFNSDTIILQKFTFKNILNDSKRMILSNEVHIKSNSSLDTVKIDFIKDSDSIIDFSDALPLSDNKVNKIVLLSENYEEIEYAYKTSFDINLDHSISNDYVMWELENFKEPGNEVDFNCQLFIDTYSELSMISQNIFIRAGKFEYSWSVNLSR